LYDVTRVVAPEMSVWPGDQPPLQTWIERMSEGQACNLSAWTLGSHTGTHVDAPSHFVDGGDDVEQMDLADLVGTTEVLCVRAHSGQITAQSLRSAWPPGGARRVLLKTPNSDHDPGEPFDRNFISLDASAADFLIQRGVAAIGIDYLSVEQFVEGDEANAYFHIVHHKLLGAGIAIIEGLDLSRIQPGTYFMCCLPLRLRGSEAAPARVILLPTEDAPKAQSTPK
jgi:arylformamidase